MKNGRCRNHGGLSLSGLAHPNIRTGRYSKYLPTRLAEKYQEALADPALLSLREDIALLDARLSDVLESASHGENAELWRRSWREIRAIVQERRILVESERRRLIDMQQMLSVQQANLLLGAVAHIIRSHVTDRETLQAIGLQLNALVTVSEA